MTALVLAGRKTATCWPLADTGIGEPMLGPGDIALYTDWNGVPVVAVAFTSIEIMAFNEGARELLPWPKARTTVSTAGAGITGCISSATGGGLRT